MGEAFPMQVNEMYTGKSLKEETLREKPLSIPVDGM